MFLFFKTIVYFCVCERERERGRDRERGTEEPKWAVNSRGPDVGLELMNHKIMT